MLLFIEQVLNGLQLGIMLFLMSAGLTLVFGIMQVINLAHGSFYMIGAYVGATVAAACPFCATMLSDGLLDKEADVVVKDIAELVDEATA